MKIISYDEFIKIDTPTLYCETKPCWFGDLNIKFDSLNNFKDYYVTPLNPQFEGDFDFIEAYGKLSNGKSLKIDLESIERDGNYDYSRKYLIFEKEDIEVLIDKLKEIIKN